MTGCDGVWRGARRAAAHGAVRLEAREQIDGRRELRRLACGARGVVYWLGSQLYVQLTNRARGLSLVASRGPAFIMPETSGFAPLEAEPTVDAVVTAVLDAYANDERKKALKWLQTAILADPVDLTAEARETPTFRELRGRARATRRTGWRSPCRGSAAASRAGFPGLSS